MDSLKKVRRSIKNLSYTEAEVLVRNATSSERAADPADLVSIKAAMQAPNDRYQMLCQLFLRTCDMQQELHMIKSLQILHKLLLDEPLRPYVIHFIVPKVSSLKALLSYVSPLGSKQVPVLVHKVLRALQDPDEIKAKAKIKAAVKRKPPVPAKKKKVQKAPEPAAEDNVLDLFDNDPFVDTTRHADPPTDPDPFFDLMFAEPVAESQVVPLPEESAPVPPPVLFITPPTARPPQRNKPVEAKNEEGAEGLADEHKHLHGLLGVFSQGYTGLEVSKEELQARETQIEADRARRREMAVRHRKLLLEHLNQAMDEMDRQQEVRQQLQMQARLSPIKTGVSASPVVVEDGQEQPPPQQQPLSPDTASSPDASSWENIPTPDQLSPVDMLESQQVLRVWKVPVANVNLIAELAFYASYLGLVSPDMHIAPVTDAISAAVFLDRLASGTLLAEVVNFIDSSAIDTRVLTPETKDMTLAGKMGNLTLALQTAGAVGVSTCDVTVRTFYEDGSSSTDLGGVKQAERLTNVSNFLFSLLHTLFLTIAVDVDRHPELVTSIMPLLDLEDVAAFETVCDTDRLLVADKWLAWYAAKQPAFSTTLLARSAEWFQAVFEEAPEKVSVSPRIRVLRSLQLLDDQSTALPEEVEEVKAQRPKLKVKGSTKLTDKSTKAYALWINSLNIKFVVPAQNKRNSVLGFLPDTGALPVADLWDEKNPGEHSVTVFVRDLVRDCQDGLVLLCVLDHVKPGCVNWKEVNKRPGPSPFRRIANCNIIVKTCQTLGFSLVGVSGDDIANGKLKPLLAAVWQLLKFHIGAFIQQINSLTGQSSLNLSGEEDVSDSVAFLVNRKLGRRGCRDGKVCAAEQVRVLNSFAESDTCMVFLDLLFAFRGASAVSWTYIDFADTTDAKHSNARYAISAARKLGCTMFYSESALIKTNSKAWLTMFASVLMTCLYTTM